MGENASPNLELEQILATLASLQKPEGNVDTNVNQPFDSYLGQHVTLNPLQQEAQSSTQDPRLARQPATHPTLTPKAQEPNSAPIIDPSTITEWKLGLRCVSKIASQKSDFAASIRKLIKEQESNMKQWEAGRERLIEDQKLKKENEQTHRAALSLPGLLENSPLLRTTEREKEELEQYDIKVYRATKAMTLSQTQSLKLLGVPFFGIKPHLVLHESEAVLSTVSNELVGPANNPKITPKELLLLQRKMLNHLVEMYGD